MRTLLVRLTKLLLILAVVMMAVATLLVAVIETGWGKNELRRLLVQQANRYLTATLTIDRLRGSLVTGVTIDGIRISRDGAPIISIQSVALTYRPRDLWTHGVLDRLRIVQPEVRLARESGGRWNVETLLKPATREGEPTGPGRPIHVVSAEVLDAEIVLRDPVEFGGVHIPTRYERLNASLSFESQAFGWRIGIARASWQGTAPDLSVERLVGEVSNGPMGLSFQDFRVVTPRTAFTLAGTIDRSERPTRLDLTVRADRFDFQEWAGLIHGFEHIAVRTRFDARLVGPINRIDTRLEVGSSAGSIQGGLVLDTTVPGWHGAGTLYLSRLNLARWLDRPDRPSDISARVTFALAFGFGQHWPRGTYAFTTSHTAFMGYAADDLLGQGEVTAHEVRIAVTRARAYHAAVTMTRGTIALREPFRFTFEGSAVGVDLRDVPSSIPVPHVESRLAFDYTIRGRFSSPFLIGQARFDRSEFLGAVIEAGSTGDLDTSADPVRFGGNGAVDDLDLRRLGEGFEIPRLLEPRYRGTVSGRWHVKGAGTSAAALTLTGTGHVNRARLFGGTITDADVGLDVAGNTVRGTFDGGFAGIDAAIPMADTRFTSSLTGAANIKVTLNELLSRAPSLADVDVAGSVTLRSSSFRGSWIDHAQLEGRLSDEVAEVTGVDIAGPMIVADGAGTLSFQHQRASSFDYDVERIDLAEVSRMVGVDLRGTVSTIGHLSGIWPASRVAGEAEAQGVRAEGVAAQIIVGHYELTIPWREWSRVAAQVTGRASVLTILGQPFAEAVASLAFADNRLGLGIQVTLGVGRSASTAGTLVHEADRWELSLSNVIVNWGGAPWRLAPSDQPPIVTWTATQVTVTPIMLFGGPAGNQRLAIDGTWRPDGLGSLKLTGTRISLDALQDSLPARYGGTASFEATIRGTREQPVVTGSVTIADGRVLHVPFQQLTGHVSYAAGTFDVDLTLDQSDDVWVKAVGRVPLSVFDRRQQPRALNVALTSSAIGLELIGGLTDVLGEMSGSMQVAVNVTGTSERPRLDGTLDITNAAFTVARTGVRYQHGRASIAMAGDRMSVDRLHIEDGAGHALDVNGSLGTRELRIETLALDATARQFEVLANDLGHLDVDAQLRVRGTIDRPIVVGEGSVRDGTLRVDEILERVFMKSYITKTETHPTVDALAALSPWDRLGLDVQMRIPSTVRFVGEDVQVSPGTPIGLGDIKLHVGGDISLRKAVGERLAAYGSLDSISGTYTFEGREFRVAPNSAIAFRGALSPELSVTVDRLISGVLVHVAISGDLSRPVLTLTSTPPLDSSDILALVVFSAPLNQLGVGQQQELALRAGTLAAGFLATPLVSAIQRSLGLETFRIEPSGELGGAARLTIAEQLAPGLTAEWVREFGAQPFQEVTIEYYVSRVLRIRVRLSNTSSAMMLSQFYLIEPAGIDLVFSFAF